jgi:DedD protein
MADSTEALDLKRRARRRLTGAIALVLALVLVPPWLMDLEPKPVQTDLTVQIPPQDGARLKPPAPPEGVKPAAAQAAIATPAPEPAPQASQPASTSKAPAKAETAPSPAPPAAIDKERASDQEADAKRAQALLSGESFVIPLGAFANRDNVASLEGKLAKAGVKHYTERITAAGGEQTRVRAGPYPTREAAEKAREQLLALGLAPGRVVAKQ